MRNLCYDKYNNNINSNIHDNNTLKGHRIKMHTAQWAEKHPAMQMA